MNTIAFLGNIPSDVLRLLFLFDCYSVDAVINKLVFDIVLGSRYILNEVAINNFNWCY